MDAPAGRSLALPRTSCQDDCGADSLQGSELLSAERMAPLDMRGGAQGMGCAYHRAARMLSRGGARAVRQRAIMTMKSLPTRSSGLSTFLSSLRALHAASGRRVRLRGGEHECTCAQIWYNLTILACERGTCEALRAARRPATSIAVDEVGHVLIPVVLSVDHLELRLRCDAALAQGALGPQ